MSPEDVKKSWIAEYAKRILSQLTKWKTPLGIDEEYKNQIESDLESFYEDPLKKQLIEQTY